MATQKLGKILTLLLMGNYGEVICHILKNFLGKVLITRKGIRNEMRTGL
jgi:hypothetical protein